MIALSMILAVMIWAIVSFFVARAIARLLPGWWPQLIALVLIFPVLMVAPIADELIGKRQFEQLCQDLEHEGVKYYGKIELGPEFYFEDGTPKWVARNSSRDERDRVRAALEELHQIIGVDKDDRVDVGQLIPIQKYTTYFTERSNGKILAAFSWYATHGGMISQGLEAPLFTAAQCWNDTPWPAIYNAITYKKSP